MNDAYLLVHFIGDESELEHEQVYFSVSADGRIWKILNHGRPMLWNSLGEKGVRDPFIVRSASGNHFYIIATDLSIYHRRQNVDEDTAWRQCTNALSDNPCPGSRGIVIWESDDLIHWGRERIVEVAPQWAGCFWAPKCIWDKEKQAYMVVGASKMPEDVYGHLRLYRAYTRDFKIFTKAELYCGLSGHIFDCIFVECEGCYYRLYKTDRIQMDMADSLSGIWKSVCSNIHTIAPHHEGPAVCKENGTDTWLLLLDNLTTHGGYQIFRSNCLRKGQFQKDCGELSFPRNIKYRHGSLLPITGEEYHRLLEL